MNHQISDLDQEILILLVKGEKPREIKIGGLSTKTIYGRIRNLRLEFGVKTNKELIEAYEQFRENQKSA
ncbi:MAG: hypothetical protein WBM32_07200 [Crocosphaera sp.]|jgi:DNA-binding CsgD family transcriptional regulator